MNRPVLCVACVASLLGLLGSAGTNAMAQSVMVDVGTDGGNDTLIVGGPGSIIFTVDANGNNVAGLAFPFEIDFAGGNMIGPISDVSGEVIPSTEAMDRFESIAWNAAYGQGTDPDTMLYNLVDFGGPLWDISGEVFRITVTPVGEGTIRFDSISLPPVSGLSAVNDLAEPLPVEWLGDGKEIIVAECPVLMGDFTGDGIINAADIVFGVGALFKCYAVIPDCGFIITDWRITDVNCSGTYTAADPLWLVNYVFKSGPPPCACYTFAP